MNFSGNVDDGPSDRWLYYGDAPDSGGTFGLALIINQPTYVLLLCILYIISVSMHWPDYWELFCTMTCISLFIHWTFWKVWKAFFFFYHVGSVLSHHQSVQFMQKPWWITLLFSLLRYWQHLLQSTTVSNWIAPVQRSNNQSSEGANMLWRLIIPRLPQMKPPYHHV